MSQRKQGEVFFLAGGTVSSSQLGRGKRDHAPPLLGSDLSFQGARQSRRALAAKAPARRREIEWQVPARGATCLWTPPGLIHPTAGIFPG